jgi:hypothetical protein
MGSVVVRYLDAAIISQFHSMADHIREGLT